jgi:hypothetical protein
MRRTTQLFLIVSQFVLVSPRTLRAQLALAAGAGDEGPGPAVNRALLAAALKPVLTIRLMSDWPQLTTPDGTCLNGGQETLTGTLELSSGGNYLGTLTRQAEIRFCGAHGAASDACELTLVSVGPVDAKGEVYPFNTARTNPVVELRWATAPVGTEVHVEGNCAPEFDEALRRMYLGAGHVIEIQIPLAGEGPLNHRLEDYGWLVEVQ